MLSRLQLQINEKIFLKNPETSELGKRIITQSVDMIDDIGFDCFTFRKLSVMVDSTEASIYRYFENKHKLLLYLTSWYWNWMEYRLMMTLTNIDSPHERLERAIRLLTTVVESSTESGRIDMGKLNRIVFTESSKTYLTKSVDEENREGMFADYKNLVNRVSEIILEINPTYKFPNMLVSTVIEGAHLQRYFALHLPKLTNVIEGEDAVTTFYLQLAKKSISN